MSSNAAKKGKQEKRPPNLAKARLSEVLSVAEFCGLYSVGMTKVYSEIKTGRLAARKSGRRTLILATDAQLWAANLPPIAPKSAAA